MARLNVTFATVVTACVVAVHALLLPALYFGVGYVIRGSHEDLFVQHARTFARVLADEFEVGGALESASKTADLLDLAVIHGEARYAEVIDGGRSVRSGLGSAGIEVPRRTDLRFGSGDDGLYFVVLPIDHAGHGAELRIGFDEIPTKERIQLALNRMLWLLGAYLAAVIAACVYLSNRLARPIRRLQDAARAISSGDYAQALEVKSGARELRELAVDLDTMRDELVGVNRRLLEQIKEKDLAEVRRGVLEKQLRHRQRLETVGTLAGGIAHEFNNVLVPIMLFTDIALQDLPPDSISRADLERVLISARRAKQVVQKILTFSHVLDDAMLAAIDLRVVLNEGLNLFTALAPRTIAIRAQIGENVPAVSGDAALALDLVMNLCTNALQSMQGMKGVLTVGLCYPQRGFQPQAGDPLVELWVTDTGHGMDPATAERIFEPFFTTRPVGEGTGLGLAVVHGIVKSFNARIVVETAVGSGTSIRVLLHPSGSTSMDAGRAAAP